jgi:cell wall-associated NlpC family hydrolase
MHRAGPESDRVSSVVRRLWLLASFLVACSCAPTVTTARPSPFPGAVAPPAPAGPPAAPAPVPAAAPIAGESLSEALIDTALSFRGVPYILGGEDPKTGFDCSGFVRYVFARHAIGMARTVIEQYGEGLPVRLTDLRAGDLVFFSTTGPGPTHVGIALNHDQFVHAPTTNGVVRVEPIDSSYWHNRFVGARRLF